MDVHPHEQSKDYMMRGPFTRNGKDNSGFIEEWWEDCRILSKFKIKKANGREEIFCNIECRLREDLGETVPFRPPLPVK